MKNYIWIPRVEYKREIDWSSKRVQKIGEQFQYLGPYSPISKYVKIFNSVKMEIVPITVIYGASGSGKSTLLREIRKLLPGNYLFTESVSDDYLINLVGNDIQEAISILSSVGLGQGHLFLSKYKELSEGQKFRLRLALQLSKKDSVIYVDEFGSGLDVTTAKNLAITFGKHVRRNGKTAFICCNNYDVACALQPDQIIEMDYGNGITIVKKEKIGIKPKIDIKIEQGGIDDYYKLKKYHYLQDDTRMDDAKILIAKVEDKLVGVQVCTSALSRRREQLHPFFKLVNRSVLTGQRTIVHPEYNNCGIGKLLVRSAANYFGYPIFELRSALFRYAPMPIKWGMKEYENPYYSSRKYHDALEKYIRQLGYNSSFFISKEYTDEFIKVSNRKKLILMLQKASNERHIFLLNYFINIMKEKGIKIQENISELYQVLVSMDEIKDSDEEIQRELLKHADPIYRSFYYFNDNNTL